MTSSSSGAKFPATYGAPVLVAEGIIFVVVLMISSLLCGETLRSPGCKKAADTRYEKMTFSSVAEKTVSLYSAYFQSLICSVVMALSPAISSAKLPSVEAI
uniref:Uncharacterized protein n=1 Tax=uncultured bacterium BLR5 TaxID=506522 RepID=C0INV6_9BACT|nr:hypothetical protein AKSOIL_0029 [uncultured bacterium BLR5]